MSIVTTVVKISESETQVVKEAAGQNSGAITEQVGHRTRNSYSELSPVARSLADAEGIVLSEGGTLCFPEPEAGYARRGQLIGQTTMHWVQQVSDRLYLLHFKSDLPTSLKLHGVYEIQYPFRGRTVVHVLSRVTDVQKSRQRARTSISKRSPRAIAFEYASRIDALRQFPELGGAYALVDAVEANASAQFPNDDRAQNMVVKAALAAMILNLSNDRLPDDHAVTRAVQQRVKAKRPRDATHRAVKCQ